MLLSVLVCFYLSVWRASRLLQYLISPNGLNFYFLFVCKSQICVVFFLQPCHAAFIFLWFSSCFLWKMKAECTQLSGRETLHVAGTNTEVFQACALSQLSQRSNQILLGNISLHKKKKHKPLSCFARLLFVLPLSSASDL